MNVNNFANCTSPQVTTTLTIEDVFQKIKNNKTLATLSTISETDRALYDKIKVSLQTVRFNFLFKKGAKVSNKNIISNTGLIYIDVDDSINIDLNNELIYACWRSLSGKGLGILVKVSNLDLNNYKEVYNKISQLLDLPSDDGARKATQQTVLPYDPNIYINNNSVIFNYIEKVSSHPIIEKKEDFIVPYDTFLEYEGKVRFNNINDYFKDNDNEYIFFDNKEDIINPFIRTSIPVGKRNKTLNTILCQYAYLNPTRDAEFLFKLANVVNKRFEVKYPQDKLESIAKYIHKINSEGKIYPYYNESRRILFNPKIKLTRKEKLNIVNKKMGEFKRNKTAQEIYDVLENWDFDNGKITQKKVVELSGKSIATIKRYWGDFKDYVKELNTDHLSNDNIKDNITPVKEEIVAETPSEMPITYNDDEWTPIEGSNDGLFSDLIKKNEKEINNLLKYEIKEEKIEHKIDDKHPMFGEFILDEYK